MLQDSVKRSMVCLMLQDYDKSYTVCL